MSNAVDASEQQLAISMHLLVTSPYDKANYHVKCCRCEWTTIGNLYASTCNFPIRL